MRNIWTRWQRHGEWDAPAQDRARVRPPAVGWEHGAREEMGEESSSVSPFISRIHTDTYCVKLGGLSHLPAFPFRQPCLPLKEVSPHSVKTSVLSSLFFIRLPFHRLRSLYMHFTIQNQPVPLQRIPLSTTCKHTGLARRRVGRAKPAVHASIDVTLTPTRTSVRAHVARLCHLEPRLRAVCPVPSPMQHLRDQLPLLNQ
jgi:hypothetical protein